MASELKSDLKSFFEAPNHDVFHKELGNQMTVEAWIFVTDMAGERVVINKENSWEFGIRHEGFFNPSSMVVTVGHPRAPRHWHGTF